jgi:hypothetical protein
MLCSRIRAHRRRPIVSVGALWFGAAAVGLALTAAATAASAGPRQLFRPGDVTGVWMGAPAGRLKYNPIAGRVEYDAAGREVQWRVVFADGSYFLGLPVTGLADFDPGASRRAGATGMFIGGRWGTWGPADGGAFVARAGETTERVVRMDANRLKIGDAEYVRAAEVNGLRLNGAWTYMSDPNDPYLDQPGCRQILWLTLAGTFTDKGVFVSDCRAPRAAPRDAPGKGTYEIRDFSLVLHYEDGRVVHRSLTGVVQGNPKADDRQFFVQGQLWYKRKQ